QVSATGGRSPQFTSGGRELVYLSHDHQLIAVSLADVAAAATTSTRLSIALPKLADVDTLMFPTVNAFTVAEDGSRILAAVRVQDPTLPPVNVIINWRSLIASDREQ
ncbi:MAG TPA: hypothetical protein VJ691_11970, partial [Vicinamibacterales bacterium]|nr:hypothetical protein [Vicinamibacterales bacterium]